VSSSRLDKGVKQLLNFNSITKFMFICCDILNFSSVVRGWVVKPTALIPNMLICTNAIQLVSATNETTYYIGSKEKYVYSFTVYTFKLKFPFHC
jgi:hypothetical protein